jgi:hypothetical protein
LDQLRSKFFSNRDVAQDTQLETLERQQILLLEALRGAAGAPVSYDALRDAGIEFPASVASELELAGVSLGRCYEDAHGSRRVIGVRLEAGGDEDCVPVSRVVAPGRRPVPWALAAAVVVAVALMVAALSAGGGHKGHTVAGSSASSRSAHRRRAPPTRQSGEGTASTGGSTSAHATSAPRLRSTPRTPVSAALAARLESQGHELLRAGRYDDALPVLKRALAATGENVGACVQPASERCLTYAYALYDLGRALMLDGSAAAAVGVLENRLQIENQRAVVAAELSTARRELG